MLTIDKKCRKGFIPLKKSEFEYESDGESVFRNFIQYAEISLSLFYGRDDSTYQNSKSFCRLLLLLTLYDEHMSHRYNLK